MTSNTMITHLAQCSIHQMTFNDIFTVLDKFSDDELENLDENTLIEHIQSSTSSND
jgi:hypothetical protein